MAIDTINSYQEFTADGHTAYFAFNFNYVNASEIVVGKRTGDNTYETVAPEYYQVIQNAAENGGQVRFISNPSGSEIVDNPVPAGTIVRIERRSPETSNATWQLGLEMTEIVDLFDTLFRLVQENTGRFDNTIETFATQHGIKLYELLAKHTDKLFYWDDEKKTITPTDFPRQDVVRSVGGLFFRIRVDESTNTPYLEWSKNGIDDWHSIDVSAIENTANIAKETADQAIETANTAISKLNDKADKSALEQEKSDRVQADKNLQSNINDVNDAVGQLESELTTKASASDVQTVKNDLGDLGDQVSNIEEKIPGQASATNQLADKAFVNSATQTATAYMLTKTEAGKTYETKSDATSKKTELDGKIKTNTDDINSIKSKIPANASAQNQLATKADIEQAGGFAGVNHDDTLTGTGTIDSPLSLSDTITKPDGVTIERLNANGPILRLKSAVATTYFLLERTGGVACIFEAGSAVGLLGTSTKHPLHIRTNYETQMTINTDGSVILDKDVGADSDSNQVATTKWINDKFESRPAAIIREW